LKNPKKILLVIQRSNGDVFLSLSLINALYEFYNSPKIDLLVNDDTLKVASLLPNLNNIFTFSYKKKRNSRFSQEINLIRKIYRKYDLSINLTSSDRSVLYALLASKKSISAVENDPKKSWWKKFFLTHYYFFDVQKHILCNNLEPLNFLKINHSHIQDAPKIPKNIIIDIKKRLEKKNISKFIIFHPSAQYQYKIFSQECRDELLSLLSKENISVVITGGDSEIDLSIKNKLPKLNNIYDWIGETSIEEYIALSEISLGYIGMDTLNMHIAAAQNKRIFAIFGPTILSMWSPWSNKIKSSAKINMPKQTYGNITIFQANMHCVACGKAGCDNKNGISKCLNNISPIIIASSVKSWLKNVKY
jgi:heptosyltransferase III